MPLYKTITVSPNIKLLVWKVTEEENDLERDLILTPGSVHRLKEMKSELHRRAYLSVRHLFSQAGYQDEDVYYDSSGKPHLRDGAHISITHSFNYTGIIISTKEEVGIDIEKKRPKILRIAHKFTTFPIPELPEEQENTISRLTILWGCKESIYKIFATPGLSFLKNIYVEEFSLDTKKPINALTRYANKETTFKLQFIEFEGFICVYALQDYIGTKKRTKNMEYL